MQQNYAYDGLNRLSWAQEYIQGSGNTPGGGQSYSYDRWGNRTLSGSGTGINTKQFTIDAATNRYGVPTGQAGVMQYDGNGNLTNDTYSGFGVRTYDAENRMVTATDSSGGQSIYTYDGEGRRVRRQSAGQVTWQVYGMDGELVAEYAAGAATTAVQKEYGYRNGELLVTAQASANVQWMVVDQLGTPRIIADRTGSLSGIRRHDYLPFGEELMAGSGNRTAAGGYVVDGVRQKFTQKERDVETGLDYFNARYYLSVQGRFTSADSFGGAAPNPQSLNLYVYVQNNPLTLRDPTGHMSEGPDRPLDHLRRKQEKEFVEARDNLILEPWRVQDYGAMYMGMQPQDSSPELVEDNPESIEQSGPGCNIAVAFEGGREVSLPDSESYGFSFTVFGSVTSGGIGHIGLTENQENPRGRWTIEQWTWHYSTRNDRLLANDQMAKLEEPLPGNYLIKGNKFSWVDIPRVNTTGLTSYYSKWNFIVKVLKGKKECKIGFHLNMTYSNGTWNINWGRGMY